MNVKKVFEKLCVEEGDDFDLVFKSLVVPIPTQNGIGVSFISMKACLISVQEDCFVASVYRDNVMMRMILTLNDAYPCKVSDIEVPDRRILRQTSMPV